ncbi:hypothetical protein SRHO_G00160980 [Serrasalmus rhombeus]
MEAQGEAGIGGLLAPSPQSEAVTHEMEELSLQPSQNLPPLNERKNESLLQSIPSSVTVGVEDSEVPASVSWGDQLDEAEPLMDDFIGLTAIQRISAVVDSESDSLGKSEGLFSEEEDCDESTFILSAQTQLNAAGAHGSDADSPPFSVDQQDVCKSLLLWPSVLADTTSSRYERKLLPRTKQTARQLLPVFPKCKEELTRSWNNPFSAKNSFREGQC